MRVKIAIVCILALVVYGLATPFVAIALPTVGVGITSTGSDPILPDCPTNFVLVKGIDNVTMTWTMGMLADNTMIVRRVGGYPDTMADGELVYNGVGVTYTDNTPNLDEVEYYYRVWSWNATGYSVCYASAYTGGETMAASIGMIAIGLFIICGLGINVFSWWQKKWWLCPVAFFYFVTIGYFCYTSSAGATDATITTFDTYRMFTWLCVSFALASLGEMWYIYQSEKEKPEPEDDMRTKNRKRISSNLKNTFNRHKPTRQGKRPMDEYDD